MFAFGLQSSMSTAYNFGTRAVVTAEALPQFKTTWNTEAPGTSNSDQVTLPLISGGSYNFQVAWGDGQSDTITAWDDAAKTHTYNSSGNYDITITGEITGWQFASGGDCQKVSNIESWGPFKPGNTWGHFYGCVNMTCNATDTPNITGTTNLHSMFRNCDVFNGVVDDWDTSSVTDITDLFRGCDTFNQTVNWDVSSVTLMKSTFRNCVAFNKSLSWNTHNVTNMFELFRGCTVFNQSLSWNTHNVTTLVSTLRQCPAFNQNLSWNTANVTNMADLFNASTSFNGDVTGWDVAKVTDMECLFEDTAFNRDLSSWNTANVTDMVQLFYNTPFDQNIGGWDISSVANATGMFQNSQLSTANYDALLTGWNGQSHQDSVTFHGGSSTYTANSAASAARDDFTNNHSWSITDGGAA